MTDRAKRTTLKRLGALSAVSATGLTTGLSGAVAADGAATAAASTGPTDTAPLGGFEVHTRVSASSNDLEVVLTNTGEHTATITQMTPAETVTRRGRFVFGDLFDDTGRLTLGAGESVSVPLQRHPVVLDGSSVHHRAASLADTLRRGVSIVVDDAAFAPVTVRNHALFA